jgi:Co/Zn/Cd efflux system component
MKPLTFSLKVWLTSVVLGTLIFYFIGHPTDDSSMTFWEYILVGLLYALLLSCVSFFVFWAALTWLTKRPLPKTAKRWITTFIGLILTAAPFPILFGGNHPDWRMMSEFASCYAAPIVAGTWLFKFPV